MAIKITLQEKLPELFYCISFILAQYNPNSQYSALHLLQQLKVWIQSPLHFKGQSDFDTEFCSVSSDTLCNVCIPPVLLVLHYWLETGLRGHWMVSLQTFPLKAHPHPWNLPFHPCSYHCRTIVETRTHFFILTNNKCVLGSWVMPNNLRSSRSFK